MDELSFVLAPAADGEINQASVFERTGLLSKDVSVGFRLKEVHALKDNTVWLTYLVRSPEI